MVCDGWVMCVRMDLAVDSSVEAGGEGGRRSVDGASAGDAVEGGVGSGWGLRPSRWLSIDSRLLEMMPCETALSVSGAEGAVEDDALFASVGAASAPSAGVGWAVS